MTERVSTTAMACIVGMGDTGLRVVSNISKPVQGVECIGIKQAKSGPDEGKSNFVVIFPEAGQRDNSSTSCAMDHLETIELILLVASLDEGLQSELESFCEAATNRFKKVILVAPVPADASDRRGGVIRNIKEGDINRPYKISFPKTTTGMVNSLYSMIFVNHEIMSLCPDSFIQKNTSGLTEYLLNQALEILIYFITSKPSYTYQRFTMLQPIWRMAVRYSVGIASGQWKGAVAVERAISSLKLQAVRNYNIEGVLCHITKSLTTTQDDIKAVKLSLSSLLEFDTPVIYGISVDEQIDDDVIVVSILAAEKLWCDKYSASEHWTMLSNDDEVRHIPAFVRKKWC